MVLGASQWSINPTCYKPGGVLLHENCEGDGPTMQVRLNENRSHKKKEQTRKEKEKRKSHCHLQNNGNHRRKLLTPVVQL